MTCGPHIAKGHIFKTQRGRDVQDIRTLLPDEPTVLSRRGFPIRAFDLILLH